MMYVNLNGDKFDYKPTDCMPINNDEHIDVEYHLNAYNEFGEYLGHECVYEIPNTNTLMYVYKKFFDKGCTYVSVQECWFICTSE